MITKVTTINTGDGAEGALPDDLVNVRAIGGPSNINTGRGRDEIVVGSFAGLANQGDSKLDGILNGFLTIDAGEEADGAATTEDILKVIDAGQDGPSDGKFTGHRHHRLRDDARNPVQLL